MNVLLVLLVSINLNIPDSVFLPTNALEINPPEWKFVFETGESDYLELGYHTTFGAKIKSFYLRATENYDFEPYVGVQNRYFISTPYFSFSHGLSGIYRYDSKMSLVFRDTLDFYFSAGRIIPNITLLPGFHYLGTDSTKHTEFNLPVSFSVVYSGSEGVLTCIGIERPDILADSKSQDIYRVGVGIMGSRKFVSLGLTSKLIPEFNLKVLVSGGAYINVHYGYDVKTPDIFSYLYPDGISGDSILSVMEKRFSILVDKAPVSLNFVYSMPDSIFKKSMVLTFAWKDEYFDISGRYFKTFGGDFTSDYYGTIVNNRAVSKGKIRFHIPIWQNLKYNPFLNIYRVQGKSENVYNLGGKLEYNAGKFRFFWEHNLYTHGVIEDYVNENLTFFRGRRFKIGTKYSF